MTPEHRGKNILHLLFPASKHGQIAECMRLLAEKSHVCFTHSIEPIDGEYLRWFQQHGHEEHYFDVKLTFQSTEDQHVFANDEGLIDIYMQCVQKNTDSNSFFYTNLEHLNTPKENIEVYKHLRY